MLRLAAIKPRTIPELATEVDAAPTTVLRNLTRLEAAGLIEADTPPGERVGVVVTWSTNKRAVLDAAKHWGAYMTGAPLDREEVTDA
ncbi:winged helix-turn-helix transcriptional regulator [Nocardioides sp. W3-2-3]|uniref:winged helix-turn-helix transcriptional regulator n=1 Tax=Nocardioides convexus TaxID=2712224 RepID=UPI0024187DDC|nr:winged helix-turn-helix domain-containing protein [Nocardioides convexus]NHA02137.1 winged helix-turn-helix transcriptional regulator [Nocardioides convexus]